MPDPARARVARARVEKLAWLLDGSLRIPGTRIRFGLDAIVGLIPGIGDVLGLLLGAGILYESLRVGVPRALLLKMIRNNAMDTIGGLVPGVGDLFDFAFRSNARNAKLLLGYLDELEAQPPPQPRRGGSRLLALLLVTVIAALGIGLVLLAWTWWRHR